MIKLHYLHKAAGKLWQPANRHKNDVLFASLKKRSVLVGVGSPAMRTSCGGSFDV